VTPLPKAGRYELLEELGRGAMGVVYKAHDPMIGRTVAVKTMRLTEEGTGMTRAELIARFQTEARAAGLLVHPNIVVVYDAGEDEGVFYITMEHVEGRSLQALLDAKQSFPLPRVLRLMEQACSALEFAHQRSVVHRDIKPANLMLTPEDTLKITDFGTAKILQFGTTQTAHIVGTPSYMSPEQVKGKLVDGRSDIFSLGVILYELVTGEKPFPGQNITTVIYKIVNEDPIPPRELDSSVHSGLSYVITRALAKESAARYQNCGELLEALRNYRELGGSTEATLVLPRGAQAVGTEASGAASGATGRTAAAPRPPAAPVPAAGVTPQPEQQRKRGQIWLALALLAIIAGAGYHIWPYMRDVWERSRAARASRAPAAAPATQPTPLNAKDAKPAEEKRAETKPVAPPATKPPSTRTAGELPPVKLPSNDLKSRIEQALAEAGLGDKVHLQVAGNTVTLAGRLTPREHRQLLHRLRDAPAWVRLIDHIEYASPEPGGALNASDDRPQPAGGRGEIEVLTDVLGASAVLHGPQGRVISDCRTPCRFEGLWPGRYMLEVNQAGYRPVQRTLQVSAASIVGERIKLEPVSSGLYVTSRPPQAHVFVNGERQPDPTPTTIRLGPGSYNITVRKPGFEPYAGLVQLKGDELTQLEVELAQQQHRAGFGWAFVRTTPRGTEIKVDDAPVGQRTPARLELPVGEHAVTLSLTGLVVARRTIVVEENQTVQVNVTLH
jgi:serine/threonine-protein kinase